jgi:hypothetical protein
VLSGRCRWCNDCACRVAGNPSVVVAAAGPARSSCWAPTDSVAWALVPEWPWVRADNRCWLLSVASRGLLPALLRYLEVLLGQPPTLTCAA